MDSKARLNFEGRSSLQLDAARHNLCMQRRGPIPDLDEELIVAAWASMLVVDAQILWHADRVPVHQTFVVNVPRPVVARVARIIDTIAADQPGRAEVAVVGVECFLRSPRRFKPVEVQHVVGGNIVVVRNMVFGWRRASAGRIG